MSSADNDSSELHDLVTDANNMASLNNAPNSITSSELEIFNSLDFYLNDNDAALNFNSTMGFSDNTVSTASYQWNHHRDMTMFDMDEMNKQFSCQNYTDLTASYQPYQYEAHHQDTNINLNLDELNNHFPLQNTRQVLDSTSDLCLPTRTDIANENGFPIGICLEDFELALEDLPDLVEMKLDSGLERQEDKRITLVLDMDETLVHTVQGRCNDANFVIICDHTLYSVKERPHLHYFLEKVAEMFKIVIFTAGQRDYASQVLDKLDPEGRLFSRRLYQDSCTFFKERDYVKDLTILGVDLAKVAIIDNLPKMFLLQRDNGIPIKSWYQDQLDVELILILPFLEILAGAEDVRPLISERFSTQDNKGLDPTFLDHDISDLLAKF